MDGLNVDGIMKYAPGCNMISGVTTPHTAFEYGPDVVTCAPSVELDVAAKIVALTDGEGVKLGH